MGSCYRRFIPGFSERARPFFNTLEKGKSCWGPEQTRSFKELRRALCQEPILQYPDLKKQFILTTDASDIAVGSVLSQDHDRHDLTIAYFSRVLNNAQKNYSATEKECLAVIESVEHFITYSYGTKFRLVSDHEPLKWIRKLDDPGKRLTKWKWIMRKYDYEFVYKSGKLKSNADAHSRNPVISDE